MGTTPILYINRYFEKNLTTGNVTSYYYLGDRLVAMKKVSTLSYVHQDHLGSTALVTSDNGTVTGTMTYMPYGSAKAGSVNTDKLFTGQRLDNTGLYYYNARYYDPTIGRFISADTIVPDYRNPQSLNRYSYVLNNPLKYTDPTGLDKEALGDAPSEDGQLGWSQGQWYVSKDGDWRTITPGGSNSVVAANKEPNSFTGTEKADMAITLSNGWFPPNLEFSKVEKMTPKDFAGWLSPVSSININVYIMYLAQDYMVMNALGGGMVTVDPFIFVALGNSLNWVQNTLPEEFRHDVQYRQNPFFIPRYLFSLFDTWFAGGDPRSDSVYEVEAKNYLRMIQQTSVNLRSSP